MGRTSLREVSSAWITSERSTDLSLCLPVERCDRPMEPPGWLSTVSKCTFVLPSTVSRPSLLLILQVEHGS